MKRIWISLFFLFVYATTQAQIGVIEPGKTFLNSSSDTLFFMPKDKVIAFKMLQTNYNFSLEKIEKYKELSSNFKQRIFLADSTIALKRIEADIWYSKLQTNDMALEQQRIVNIQLKDDKDRIRRSRIYYFVGGVLATSIVFIAVK
jgi:hypothetical protein